VLAFSAKEVAALVGLALLAPPLPAAAADRAAQAGRMPVTAVHMVAALVSDTTLWALQSGLLAALALSVSSGPVVRDPSHQQTQGTYKWQLFQASFLR